MPCFSPVVGYYAAIRGESGKRGIVFDKRKAWSPVPLKLPCGKCVGCRLEKSRQWAVRCMHEKMLHSASSFLTLTYDDDHLPPHGSLRKRDLQLFMKRLRWEDGDVGIRFYACGEYGSTLYRPHYHVLLFNRDFVDKRRAKLSGSGEQLYRSDTLQKLWPVGDHYIGSVTAESCGYVAKYVMKKAVAGYADPPGLEPEFTCMSRRPGLGALWFSKYYQGVYDWDSVIHGYVEQKPPRYYDTRFEALDSARMEVLKVRRRRLASMRRADNTKVRLRVREVFELKKLEFFSKRGM